MILVSLLNVICSIFPHLFFFGVLFSDSFQCSQCVVASTLWLMLSLPILQEQIWFCVMFHLARWSRQWQLRQRNDFIIIGNQYDAFLPLAIKVFGRLHQHANDSLHQGANMMWSTKGTNGPPLVVLHVFYSKVSIAL